MLSVEVALHIPLRPDHVCHAESLGVVARLLCVVGLGELIGLGSLGAAARLGDAVALVGLVVDTIVVVVRRHDVCR